MILQLDTHSFLWFVWGDTRLRQKVRDAILDPANYDRATAEPVARSASVPASGTTTTLFGEAHEIEAGQ